MALETLPREDSARRLNIASLVEIQTINEAELNVSTDVLPWIDSPASLHIVRVESPFGEYMFGNAIGLSTKIAKIAVTEMQGRESDDDRLNRVMYESIRRIMLGQPSSVKRVRNAPEGLSIYYGGLTSGARIYFADLGIPEENLLRTFLKVGVCGSKNTEPSLLKTFTGNKKEKVK